MTLEAKIHPSAFVGPDVTLGPNSYVGPNCHIDGLITIGADAKLLGNIVLIGNVNIGGGCIIEPNVSLSMISLDVDQQARALSIGIGSQIGAGSVVLSGLTIGPGARIGAGTVVTRNVPPHAIVQGNPASIVGYATSATLSFPQNLRVDEDAAISNGPECLVRGVQVLKYPRIRDLRGDLSVGEFGRSVPFIPKRYFVVFDVPSAETRGEHAHWQCEQFLICANGSVSVVVDDGKHRQEIALDAPDIGLYIPPRTWALQYKYSAAAVLLVFASDFYDPDDYIRDYSVFLDAVGRE